MAPGVRLGDRCDGAGAGHGHVALYVTARGLITSVLPVAQGERVQVAT